MFVMPAVTVSVALTTLSAFNALSGGHDSLAWWGAGLANLPLPLLLAVIYVRKPARTGENLLFLLLLCALGSAMSGWEVFIEGAAGAYPLVIALVGTAIFLLYVFWYSRFGRLDSERLAVGNKLPDFELADAAGRKFDSSMLRGGPAVLVFYRGNWCPFCMAQVQELVDRYQELQALGVTVVMISPQSADHTRRLANKFDVPAKFLIDEGNAVAQHLGIAVANGVPVGVPGKFEPATVLPTVLVVNASGTIVYSDQTDNYRVRPEPDVFLAIVRRTGSLGR